MKKVYCLYRGSNEEIEAQKQACYTYVKLQGWEIPFAASWFIENGIDIVSVKYNKRDFEKERRESLNNINCWRL